MKTLPAALVGLLLLLTAAQAAAQTAAQTAEQKAAQTTAQTATQTVYRCGPGGREYSQAPCPAGREVDVSDGRSAEQQKAAAAVAQGQSRLADQLAAERQARERSAPAQGPAGIRRSAQPDKTVSTLDQPSVGKTKKKKATKPRKYTDSAKPAKPEKGTKRAI